MKTVKQFLVTVSLIMAAMATTMGSALAIPVIQPAQASLVYIWLHNHTGAAIGIINPYDSSHNTRATALPMGAWANQPMYVLSTGFTVIYGETCLRVPGSMGQNTNFHATQSDNGFTLRSKHYNIALGIKNSFGGALIMAEQYSTPESNVYVNHGVAAASCAGL
ncbi:hypothetical protein ERC79_00870 [Rhodococcus sp. ABRD24]|uniref:hypothetical protein n=1 Tax=Rhodococcus sp. ABRD24 TaxID=2507582 RepID=UPI00103E61A8|nr:hypothetical protein [Rhodococcus sp. ABRD24]QBJ94680.1 hypothetical protein ERC79_00870 [Rhodococcus sp. ABRD24]